MDNRALIQHAFDELANGNSRPLLDLMSDEVTWKVMGRTPWSGLYRGKPAVIGDLLRPLGARLSTRYQATAQRILVDGDLVAVEARGSAVTKNGAPYDNEYCFLYRFERGRIVEVTEYLDTELVTAALGST